MSLSVNLRHSFGDFTLDAAFDAPAGVTAIFGRSGAGKTTITNALAGLLRTDYGQISVDGDVLFDSVGGVNMPPHKRRVGYVFQEGRLFPHLNVAQNLGYGARWSGAVRDLAHEAALIEMLGIGALLERDTESLSGGEKQRVAIGRALFARPRILLMDEPLAALDAPRREEILPYLEQLRDEADIPILYVSHALSEVARLATTVVVLERGRVAHMGAAEAVLSDPEAAPAMGLRDAGALLKARLVAQHEDGLSELETSGGRLFLPQINATIGQQLRVRILAQDVLLSRTAPKDISALNILSATVVSLHEGAGPGVLVALKVGEDQILARITRRSAKAMALKVGAPCHAIMKSVSVARANIGR